MPRRKTTRAKAPAKPKTDIPDLVITEEMSKAEKAEQMDIFVKEFQFKVKTMVKNHTRAAQQGKTRINMFWETQLNQIPISLWNMTLREFVAAGGTVESVLGRENKYATVDKRIGMGFPAIEEESSDESQSQAQQANPVLGTSRAKRTTALQAPDTLMGPPVRRSARASKTKYATPANRLGRGVWGATPLITPKFDPRLPVTPDNIREMKPGERLMSMAGSPVCERKTAVAAAANLNVEEVVGHISSLFGVNLSPGGLERALRTGGVLK